MMNVPITTCNHGARYEDKIHSNFPYIEWADIEWELHDLRKCTLGQSSNHRDHDDYLR